MGVYCGFEIKTRVVPHDIINGERHDPFYLLVEYWQRCREDSDHFRACPIQLHVLWLQMVNGQWNPLGVALPWVAEQLFWDNRWNFREFQIPESLILAPKLKTCLQIRSFHFLKRCLVSPILQAFPTFLRYQIINASLQPSVSFINRFPNKINPKRKKIYLGTAKSQTTYLLAILTESFLEW